MKCPNCHAGMETYGQVVYHAKRSRRVGKPALLYTCPECHVIKIVELPRNGSSERILYYGREGLTLKEKGPLSHISQTLRKPFSMMRGRSF